MVPALSRYPLKAAATFAFILCAPSYLALIAVLNIPRSRRPNREWSLKTTIGCAWLRVFYRFATKIRLQQFHANPKKLGDRYVLVQPGDAKLYQGILEHSTIHAKSMPAVWFPKALEKDDKSQPIVVIHFQGGAFVTGTDPEETGQLPSRIFGDKLGATTFYAQYRLSRDEQTRFPAAIQDIVTFYQYVLSQGVSADNVVLSGDSAGGHLVLAFLKYLHDYKDILPSPRGAMVWSPWIDITDDAIERYKSSPQLATDFLPLTLIQWGKDAYLPAGAATSESDRYTSMLKHPFQSNTPIFINAGTAELLHEEIRDFADKMKAVPGNQIRFHETQHAPHDIIVAGGYTGFVKQAEEATEVARNFFKIDTLKTL
ncbi:alpha/beta-hydrolase [Periconia macrospinosa]|uniref:Alpha/beta-hydrolase n=1 Tax=Periconia macrospinosa TaxID=97972 RepID=A0A2V1D629_9PLEO|nr:alpha/beta-hydrolase [Periconia macrospinosa]